MLTADQIRIRRYRPRPDGMIVATMRSVTPERAVHERIGRRLTRWEAQGRMAWTGAVLTAYGPTPEAAAQRLRDLWGSELRAY